MKKNDKNETKVKLALSTETIKHLAVSTGVQAGAVKGSMAFCFSLNRACGVNQI